MKVLEASKTVRLTPFSQFIGAARNENWCVRRPEHKLPSPINYHKYLGQPYDLQFKFDNGKKSLLVDDVNNISQAVELLTQINNIKVVL
jgi:hypothetical protein